LAVSAVETMLTDTYLYFLRYFPEKYDFEGRKFSKDDILSANLTLDLIQHQVERDAILETYGKFQRQFARFARTLDIGDPAIGADSSKRLLR
jgi:hypothetical protein